MLEESDDRCFEMETPWQRKRISNVSNIANSLGKLSFDEFGTPSTDCSPIPRITPSTLSLFSDASDEYSPISFNLNVSTDTSFATPIKHGDHINQPPSPRKQRNVKWLESNCSLTNSMNGENIDLCHMIGEGTFSQVYLATDSKGNNFAMKRSKFGIKSKNDRERYLKEIKVYESMGKCEYIVNYLNAFQYSGHFWILMEFLNGGNAKEKNDWTRVLMKQFIVEIGTALAHMHENNIVHVDVKLDNVFIHNINPGKCNGANYLSSKCIFKLGDLGLACCSGDSGNEGDIRYIAPEVLNTNERFPSGDVFSFGLTILELSTKIELPMSGKVWHDIREDRINNYGCFEYILKKMLNKAPDKRISCATVVKLL